MLKDNELVAGLKAKQHTAVQALVDTYGDALLRTAYAITGNRSAAEDVVQDTLLQVCRRIDTFRGQASLKTWVYRIAINYARNVTASFWARRVDLGEPLREDEAVASPAESPDAAVIRSETQAELMAALRALPARQREALTLYYLEESSVAEISAILGVPAGTVKSDLARGRAKLKAEMVGKWGEDDA